MIRRRGGGRFSGASVKQRNNRCLLEGNMVPVVFAAIAAVALAAHPASSAEVAYFEVPRGAHPHDVAPAPDGSVWYTAQFQGALGILNPKNGQATQIALGAGSAPHGVIVGPDRAAWITDSGQNAIARFPLPSRAKTASLDPGPDVASASHLPVP